MIRLLPLMVVLDQLLQTSARGRYEFIDDADLPAFYSMRSAQLAQRAQAPVVDYSPYLPYQLYQPQLVSPTETPAMNYNPFLAAAAYQHGIYRPMTPQVARVPIPQYQPLYYQPFAPPPAQGVAAPTAVSGSSPMQKKTV